VGVELVLALGLGFLIMGPKRMHEMLGHLGRAKAHFDTAKRQITSELAAKLESSPSPSGNPKEPPFALDNEPLDSKSNV
jgi:Sec-independent protein translocase protein TatA